MFGDGPSATAWFEAGSWRAVWASRTDDDPRLRLRLPVGPVVAAAWGRAGQRPLVAACVRGEGPSGSQPGFHLQVWDVESGSMGVLPSAEPVRDLAFADVAGRTVLVSGHAGGRVRCWDVVDLALLASVDIGGDLLVDLVVVGSGDRAQAVTMDRRGTVRCWSLPNGDPVGRLDVPPSYRACAGRLTDGREVLLLGGEGVVLWDIERGVRLPLRVPDGTRSVRGVLLAVSGGRDLVTVVDECHTVTTFDLVTGVLMGEPIMAHVNRRPDGLMEMSGFPTAHPKLAVVGGTLAVPTRWRVHLWDLGASDRAGPPLTGPVGRSIVQSVRWRGRAFLLTASAHDGVLALWDLDRPVDPQPGHPERVTGVALVEPAGTMVSVDEGGTIVARHSGDGRLLRPPLDTGVEGTRALTAWADGGDLMAATGAGSRDAPDGSLRRWNLTTGELVGPPIRAHRGFLHHVSRVRLAGQDVLVTYGPGGQLKIWRPGDGTLLAEVPVAVRSAVTGVATGVSEGRAYAALSCQSQPMAVYSLDDPAAPAVVIPEAGDAVVLAIVGGHVVSAGDRVARDVVRAWHVSGRRVGPDLRGGAWVTAAAGRDWPAVYVGRADGTVTLTDVVSGRESCPPLMLPIRPAVLAVTSDGDMVVGFGSDVARVRPPAS